MPETPLERHMKKLYAEKEKEAKAWNDLKKFGHKMPSGGTVWTGRDLINYFDSQSRKGRNVGRLRNIKAETVNRKREKYFVTFSLKNAGKFAKGRTVYKLPNGAYAVRKTKRRKK